MKMIISHAERDTRGLLGKLFGKGTVAALLLAVFLISGTAWAVEYTIFGPGAGSCGTWTAAKEEDTYARRVFRSWALGYITAYNYQAPDTYDVRGQTDTSGILLWLENYCKQTPLTDFAQAMELLTDELHPKRIRKAPK